MLSRAQLHRSPPATPADRGCAYLEVFFAGLPHAAPPMVAISSTWEGAMTAPDSTMAQISRRMLSAKAEQFTESVIREMTRLAMKYGAVNLSQGLPDFPAPAEIKQAAQQAIAAEVNQ